MTRSGLFYVHFMGDILVLTPTCWRFRKAVHEQEPSPTSRYCAQWAGFRPFRGCGSFFYPLTFTDSANSKIMFIVTWGAGAISWTIPSLPIRK